MSFQRKVFSSVNSLISNYLKIENKNISKARSKIGNFILLSRNAKVFSCIGVAVATTTTVYVAQWHKNDDLRNITKNIFTLSNVKCFISNRNGEDVQNQDLKNVIAGGSTSSNKSVLKNIDKKMNTGDVQDLEFCREALEHLCIEFPEDPEVLWRLGKIHCEMQSKIADKSLKFQHIMKGINAYKLALNINSDLHDGHKGLVILLSARYYDASTKEQVEIGKMIKTHLDLGLQQNPEDSYLLHKMGQYCFGIADMNRALRKFADLLIKLPETSYAEALECFLKAEKYSKEPWKMNKLYIAKCKISLGCIEDAVRYLKEASKISHSGYQEDHHVDMDIKSLLKKYRDYC